VQVVGGTQSISLALAQVLGSKILLNAPVRKIEQVCPPLSSPSNPRGHRWALITSADT
jgi:hypothetical protein